MTAKVKFTISLVASVLWLCFIFFASGAPQKAQDSIGLMYYLRMIPYYDKVIHLGLYGVFSFLLYAMFWFSRKHRFVALKSVSIAVFIGVCMECLQYFVFIGRSADLIDGLVNSIGAILGVFCYIYSKRYFVWFR